MKWPSWLNIPKPTQETMDALNFTGIKFNIVNRIEHRFELHYTYKTLIGKERVHFVAELDEFGQIQEFGPYFEDDFKLTFKTVNADGDEI